MSRLALRTLLVMPLLGIVPLSSSAQSGYPAAGCYRFDRPYFKWYGIDSLTRRVRSDSTAVLRLLAVPFRTVFGRQALEVLPIPAPADTATKRRWLQVSNWSEVGPDSIRVEWRNGFHGPVFRLRVTADMLAGDVIQTTDAHVVGESPPRPAPAHAVRIECPS